MDLVQCPATMKIILQFYTDYQDDRKTRLVCKCWYHVVKQFEREPIQLLKNHLTCSDNKYDIKLLQTLSLTEECRGKIILFALRWYCESFLDFALENESILPKREWESLYAKLLKTKDFNAVLREQYCLPWYHYLHPPKHKSFMYLYSERHWKKNGSQ